MSFPNHNNESCSGHCCLKLEKVSVQIGTDLILKDVDLHVHCGQMVALIGPNGAGKSTLIKTVLGEREYQGTISFSEPGNITHKPRIGYVPQSPGFDSSDPVSVADLFACCMSRRPAFLGLSKSMRKKVLDCLDRVHAQDLIDKRIGTLSGGELQRVLLALALEPGPAALSAAHRRTGYRSACRSGPVHGPGPGSPEPFCAWIWTGPERRDACSCSRRRGLTR